MSEFIETTDPNKREDSYKLMHIMCEITGEEPKMWRQTMIGFGSYSYESKGCKGEWFRVGFSPRKSAFSLYLSMDAQKQFGKELENFGTFKLGKGCIYFNNLADIDEKLLRTMIAKGYKAAADMNSAR